MIPTTPRLIPDVLLAQVDALINDNMPTLITELKKVRLRDEELEKELRNTFCVPCHASTDLCIEPVVDTDSQESFTMEQNTENPEPEARRARKRGTLRQIEKVLNEASKPTPMQEIFERVALLCHIRKEQTSEYKRLRATVSSTLSKYTKEPNMLFEKSRLNDEPVYRLKTETQVAIQ